MHPECPTYSMVHQWWRGKGISAVQTLWMFARPSRQSLCVSSGFCLVFEEFWRQTRTSLARWRLTHLTIQTETVLSQWSYATVPLLPAWCRTQSEKHCRRQRPNDSLLNIDSRNVLTLPLILRNKLRCTSYGKKCKRKRYSVLKIWINLLSVANSMQLKSSKLHLWWTLDSVFCILGFPIFIWK